jgi:hypothetical protein
MKRRLCLLWKTSGMLKGCMQDWRVARAGRMRSSYASSMRLVNKKN